MIQTQCVVGWAYALALSSQPKTLLKPVTVTVQTPHHVQLSQLSQPLGNLSQAGFVPAWGDLFSHPHGG